MLRGEEIYNNAGTEDDKKGVQNECISYRHTTRSNGTVALLRVHTIKVGIVPIIDNVNGTTC